MDWSTEKYVKLYTRDTATWVQLSWQARTVLLHLLRKVDGSGMLELSQQKNRNAHDCDVTSVTVTSRDVTGVTSVTSVTALPREVVEVGIADLRDFGVISVENSYVLIVNFLAAQNTKHLSYSAERTRRYRQRLKEGKQHALQTNVTVTPVTSRDVTVTPDRHCDLLDQTRLDLRERDTRNQDCAPTQEDAIAPKVKKPRVRKQLLGVEAWQGPTDEHRQLADQLGLSATAEAESLRDWARAKGERKADWDAAFRNWLRRAAGYTGRTHPTHPTTNRRLEHGPVEPQVWGTPQERQLRAGLREFVAQEIRKKNGVGGGA